MDFQPGTGRLYATGVRPDGSGTRVLLTIDTNTGIGTEIGPTGITATTTDISFRSDGTLFAFEADAGNHQLHTIDPATGVATLVGSTGLSTAGGNAMAFDLGDKLFHSQNVWPPNNLNTLDQVTGAANLVGSLAVLPPPSPDDCRLNAMDVHPSTGTLYGIVNDNKGTGAWYLARVDISLMTIIPIATPVQDYLSSIAWEPLLWSNQDTDGLNAYSNLDPVSTGTGLDRRLLDDFHVPPYEGWIITDFHSYNIWDTLPPGSGTDFALSFYNDLAGAPDIGSGPIGVSITSSYNEVATGRFWFTREEYRTDYYFDVVDPIKGLPVCFDGGANGKTYWVEMNVVGPENNFMLVHAWPPSLSECWVNYSDYGGAQPGTSVFGTPADLAYKLTHRKVFPPVRTLEINPEVLDTTTGGYAKLSLHAGPGYAHRLFVMLAGVTGHSPGFDLPGGYAHVPLNMDYITNTLLAGGYFFGITNANGTGHIIAPIPVIGAPVYIYWAAVIGPATPTWWASNGTILNMTYIGP
jgi:hypothetical protein